MNNRSTKFSGFLKAFDRNGPLNAPANFSSFYEQTHLPVFRYLFGLIGGPQEDVEDLTADAYIRAWRARSRFQGDEQAALGWIMKIARRLVIDDYRHRKARPETMGEIPDDLPLGDLHPDELAFMKEEQLELRRLLQMLSVESREIVVLRYLLGWQVKQISAFLEIPENTVSVTIHRTLERLHQQWSQLQEK